MRRKFELNISLLPTHEQTYQAWMVQVENPLGAYQGIGKKTSVFSFTHVKELQ